MSSRTSSKSILSLLLLVFALAFAVVGIKGFNIGGVKIYLVFGFVPIVLLLPAGISHILRRLFQPHNRKDRFPENESSDFRA